VLLRLGRFLRPAIFAILGFLVSGCVRPEIAEHHDHLTIVQTQDFPSLDPIFVSGVGGQELASLLYSYLVKFDARGELVPDAALAVPTRENGGISADGRTIEYHLRPGIRFSDGTPLTSFDVAETIGHVAFPGADAPSRVAFDDVAAISTPDDRTIRVYLREPYAPILLYLCGPGNAIPILPASVLRGHMRLAGTSLDRQPLGSGPYRLAHWARGERLELEANPYYFAGMPHIGRITIVPVPSSTTALQMLRSGEVDAFVNADDAQFADLRAVANARTRVTPIDGTGALIFNTQQPVLRDPTVRRAFAEALDLPAIVGKVLRGSTRAHDPGRGLFEWAYDPQAYAMPAYDPADARKLLRGRTLHLDLIFRADKPSAEQIATLMQAQERAVGITLSLRRFDVTALVAPNGPLYGGHYDVALFPFIAGFDPDVRDQFACNRIPPHGFNKARYCNPALDALMRTAARMLDRSDRIVAYRAVQRVLAADLPIVTMYQAVSIDTFPAALHDGRGAPNTPFWNVAEWSY
jgi:peptide/nickel transport system substrate-binding protein